MVNVEVEVVLVVEVQFLLKGEPVENELAVDLNVVEERKRIFQILPPQSA